MKQRGFTVFEVLVAMAIASLALLALFGAADATTRNTAAMRDRSYGQLVASNQLAELRARRHWPATGTLTGTSELAGRRWDWKAEVTTTEDPAIRRVDFEVQDESGSTAATLIGFVGQPGGG
jgi:general secretion pathway protein I